MLKKFIFIVLLGVGCAEVPDDGIIRDPLLSVCWDSSFNDGEIIEMRKALRDWEEVLYFVTFNDRTGIQYLCDIKVYKKPPGKLKDYPHASGVAEVGGDTIQMNSELELDLVRVTMRHELGHIFGIFHCNDGGLMEADLGDQEIKPENVVRAAYTIGAKLHKDPK